MGAASELAREGSLGGSLGIGRSYSHLASHLESKQDAAGGWSGNNFRIQVSKPLDKLLADSRRDAGVAKEVELFDISVAVVAGREQEVPLLDRAGLFEQVQNLVRFQGWSPGASVTKTSAPVRWQRLHAVR